VLVAEFVDMKLHIDDPVGAFAVHGFNGLWGTFAVGLFDFNDGLFYGGGFKLLGIQCLGIVSVAGYTIVVMTIVFLILKHTVGLRVSAKEEIMGLDICEHGLPSAYADFLPTAPGSFGSDAEIPEVDVTDLRTSKLAPVLPADGKAALGRYTRISIVCNEERFSVLQSAMNQIGVTGMTITNVMGCGVQKGKTGQYRGVEMPMNLLPKIQVDIVVSTVAPELVVAAAKRALYTGNPGDGKIFLYDVENVVRVRTNEEGVAALTGPDGK
jgi:Amt family ammonium transporter